MQATKPQAGATIAGIASNAHIASSERTTGHAGPTDIAAVVGVIDLGSSAIKCMFSRVHEPDTLHLAAQIPTPTSESGLQSEFSPTLLDQAIQHAIEALAQATAGLNVIAIALTGQIGGVLLLNAQNNLIAPCLTWADRRAAAQASQCATTFEGQFETLLGHALPPQTCWSAPKLHRLAHENPAMLAAVACVMQLPDYAFYRMTGLRQSAPTVAISLANQQQSNYAAAMLHWAGLREDQLPLLPPTQVAGGRLSGALARLWHNARHQPMDAPLPYIVLSGADMYCGLHGADATQGQAIIQAGTTEIAGVVVPHHHQPALPGVLLRLKLPHAACDKETPDTNALDVIYGSTSNGGMSLSWLALQHDISVKDASLWAKAHNAAESQYNAQPTMTPLKSPLMFIPHLHGARAPLWRDDATGGFTSTGVSLEPIDPSHLLLAVLEGCAMNKLAVLQAAGADLTGGSDTPIIVAGGGAKQDLANQIRANVLGVNVLARNVTDVTAAGAIAIALDHHLAQGKGRTWLRQLHEQAGSRTYEPQSNARNYYQSLYEHYQIAEKAMLPPRPERTATPS